MPKAPLLATAIPPELANEARRLAAHLRSHPHPRELAREGAEMVVRLTEAGLDGYFLRPAKELGLGTVAQGTIRVGLATAARGIALVVRRVVGGFSDDELRRLADTFDDLIRDGAPR